MPITKSILIEGSSSESIAAAVADALSRASSTVFDIQHYQVRSIGGRVSPAGHPRTYDVRIEVVFVVRESLPLS